MQFIDAEESKWMQNIADAVHKKKMQTSNIPVVPHKAVAEVSKMKPIGEIGCCESGMAERSH